MSDMDKNAAQAAAQESAPAKKAEKTDKTKDKAAKKAKEKKPSLGARLSRWFREMRSELKKVSWPSGKDTMKNVLIVIVCVLIVGVVIGVFDVLVRAVLNALFNLF